MRVLLAVLAFAMPATASATEFTIATFNAEFLTRPRVHVKFGYQFELSEQERAIWDAPGYRDQRFAEAAAAVAGVIAPIDADVLVLTEVGNATDVAELNAAIAEAGVTYRHVAVCDCTDTRTRQHVAVLSRFPLTDVVPAIPGREGYFEEADDDDSEDDTGISKGLIVTFTVDGRPFRLYGLHLRSEGGGAEADEQRIAQASIIRRLWCRSAPARSGSRSRHRAARR